MLDAVDVVVTPAEINHQHGTGPLIKRLFKGRRNILSIRSVDHWGDSDFGDWNVKIPAGEDRAAVVRQVSNAVAGRAINTVLCVPYLVNELLTSIAIKDVFEARICTYIMDDQNVAQPVIPDSIMREFLEKCSLRLATHPELRAAYERKYGLPFFVLPAVAPAHLVAPQPIQGTFHRTGRHGALLGSFWDQSWFDRLCSALEGCDCNIDWYGNHTTPYLKIGAEEMARASIQPFGVVSEERAAEALRTYPFVIVPVGALDGVETNTGVATLSLPGRILFAAATSHTPILVVGSERTCAARFVKHFGIGETVPYDTAALAAAIDRLSDPRAQRELRARAAALAPALSDRGIAAWLSASIAQGAPADARFEELFARYEE